MSNKELEGRRIIVTGAASGMGNEIAKMFSKQGAKLLLIDVNEEGLKAVDLPGADMAAINLADPEQVAKAVDQAKESMGGIDGIVNAAGILRVIPFADTTHDVFKQVLDVNLLGPYYLCQAALPHLMEAEKATIVNFSSLAAMLAPKGMSAYASSKAGLLGLTRVLAAELGPNIRVNAITPGVIDTPMVAGMIPSDPEVAKSITGHLALGRAGRSEEVAELALFLSSERSSFITGTTTSIDGGSSWH